MGRGNPEFTHDNITVRIVGNPVKWGSMGAGTLGLDSQVVGCCAVGKGSVVILRDTMSDGFSQIR